MNEGKMKKRYGIVKTCVYDVSTIYETDQFNSAKEFWDAIRWHGESQFEFDWDFQEYTDESFDVFELDENGLEITRFEITDAGMEIVRGLES